VSCRKRDGESREGFNCICFWCCTVWQTRNIVLFTVVHVLGCFGSFSLVVMGSGMGY